MLYHITRATMVETIRPVTTGSKFFLANSKTFTPQKLATATNEDQAIKVPPPVQTDPICPIAPSVPGSIPTPGANAPDKAPTSGNPENPEPSNPVIAPVISKPKAVKTELCGIID